RPSAALFAIVKAATLTVMRVLVCRWNNKPMNVFLDFDLKDCDINVVSMNQHEWGGQCLKTSATHNGLGFRHIAPHQQFWTLS
ncbi:hypothetical protein, partial [Vibrio crassostreae]|uniref:hypothetical protein n=2 Tax=Vibrio crassostreae TaxID=246167 RepID=UPI001BD5DF15